MQIIKLGTIVTDTVTELKGMLTHFTKDMGGNQFYLFQPSGLSPETGKPVDTFWIPGNRVKGGLTEEVELPEAVLGTKVEDIATGFAGIAIGITLHINGCVHVDVKPKGIQKKTGDSFERIDFDIRRMKGEAIKQLSEKEYQESKRKNPSPAAHPEVMKF